MTRFLNLRKDDGTTDKKNIFIVHLVAGLAVILAIFFIENPNLRSSSWRFVSFFPLGVLWIWYWRDVAYFVVRYGRYLYISILYFVILGVALSLFEQTETLFARLIESESPWNFITFAVQFPLSLIIVWFLPYYLIFSDIYYKNHLNSQEIRELPNSELLLNVFLPVRMIFALLDAEKRKKLQEMYDEFNKDSKEEYWLFHRIRRVLGAGYICVLCNLLAGVSQSVGDASYMAYYPLTIGGIIIMVFYLLVAFHEKAIYKGESSREKRKPIALFGWIENSGMKIPLVALLVFILTSLFSAWLMDIYRQWDSLFNILMLLSLLFFGRVLWQTGKRIKANKKPDPSIDSDTADTADTSNTKVILSHLQAYILPTIVLLSIAVGLYFLVRIGVLIKQGPEDLDLAKRINLFLSATFCLLFAFMGLAYLRRKSRYWEIENKFFSIFIQVLDKPGTSIIMVWNMGLIILFFSAFIATLFQFDTNFASDANNLNPINLFFIFINGSVALFAFLDRAIVLLMRSYSAKSNKLRIDPRRSLRIFRPYSIKPFLEDANRDAASSEKDKLEAHNGNFTKVELSFTYKARLRMALHIGILVFVGLCISLNQSAGDYHTLVYKKNPSLEPIGLEDYVKNFLDERVINHRGNSPIYIIAADGGGLKAAYWTTRLLYALESKSCQDFQFNNDVFAASGASGGSVGLGLYTYMHADSEICLNEIDSRVEALGKYNFLSTDFGGLIARWPYKFLPWKSMAQIDDRMDVMGRNYLGTVSSGSNPNDLKIHTDPLFTKPYSYLWEKNNKLPLFITNTARIEDGSKGIMHPLNPKDAHAIFGGMMDLTYQDLGEDFKIDANTSSISFPDALMTTNRFPIFSPMAKIDGRGHFVDAGAVDNSGKGTVLQLLQYMKEKARQDTSNVYHEFFKQNIVMISIRCDKQRYFYETFKGFAPKMNQTDQEYYIPSYLGGTVSTGLTGSPRSFEGMLEDSTQQKAYGLDTEVINLSIPFYINSIDQIFEVLGSYVDEGSVYKEMEACIAESNESISKQFSNPGTTNHSRPPLLEPPLARILSQTSIQYMDQMAESRAEYFLEMIRKTFPEDQN